MTALLREGLRELGLDEGRTEALERFAALLLKKNEVMNLTAITEPEAVAQLHLLDSAALTRFVDLSGKKVVDVGTGAGLRYDLDFIVIRFDVGIGLHAPYDTGKSGWYNIPRFKDGVGLHLAIGYPF